MIGDGLGFMGSGLKVGGGGVWGGTAGWTHQKMTSGGRGNVSVTHGAGRQRLELQDVYERWNGAAVLYQPRN